MSQRERFEAWLKSEYGDMFEPIGEDEADTAARLVKIVASEAHKAAEAAAQWQPIDSAPKDDTRVWAWFPFANEAYAVRWRQNVYHQEPNWTLDDGESATLNFDAPTHWMPLPAAPVERGGEKS